MNKIGDKIRELTQHGSLYLLRRASEWPCQVERVTLSQHTQDHLRTQFAEQLDAFGLESKDPVDYKPFDAIDDGQVFKAPVFPTSGKDTEGLRFSPDLERALRSGDGLKEFDPDSGTDDIRAVAWVAEHRQFNHAIVAFQAFERSQLLTPERVLRWLRGNVYEVEQASLLALRGELDSVFSQGFLYFKKDYYTKRYIELSEFADEATTADTNAFFKLSLFHYPDGVEIPVEDAWVRRKVSALLARKKELLACKPADIKAAASKLRLELTVETIGGKDYLVLPSEKRDIKNLLRFLDEDFYESWRGASFQASSKRRL